MHGFPDSYWEAEACTPSDATVVNYGGIYVGGTGNVTIVTPKGTSVTFSAVPVGTIIPVAAKQVLATGTTATLIVGFTRS